MTLSNILHLMTEDVVEVATILKSIHTKIKQDYPKINMLNYNINAIWSTINIYCRLEWIHSIENTVSKNFLSKLKE